MLDFIETSALSPDVEVSLAALQSLQEILNIVLDESSQRNYYLGGSKSHGGKKHGTNDDNHYSSMHPRMVEASAAEAPSGLVVDKVLWDKVWKVWTSIGLNATLPANNNNNSAGNKDADDSGKASSSESSPASVSSPVSDSSSTSTAAAKRVGGVGGVYVPSQPFLTALMNIFPILFSHIKSTFEMGDFDALARVLKGALAVPVQGESTPFLVPSFTDLTLTPLQVCERDTEKERV